MHAEGQLRYVYHPVVLDTCGSFPGSECSLAGRGGRLQLPGYGVELALKNMEYSAMDDAQVRPACIAGFYCFSFSVLPFSGGFLREIRV